MKWIHYFKHDKDVEQGKILCHRLVDRVEEDRLDGISSIVFSSPGGVDEFIPQYGEKLYKAFFGDQTQEFLNPSDAFQWVDFGVRTPMKKITEGP